MDKPEREIILKIKQRFGWPLDGLRYGYGGTERFWDGKIAYSQPSAAVQERIKYSLKKLAEAEVVAKTLSKIPWVQAVFVTGSVASLNAASDDDIDFWLIVSSKRIWLTRLCDWLIFLLQGKRRLVSHGVDRHKVANRYCFNFYTTTESMTLKKKNVSFAMQFVDAIPVWWRNDSVFATLIKENEWVAQYFPEWYAKNRDCADSILANTNTVTKQGNQLIDLLEYVAGVLMLLKATKKLKLKRNDIFVDQFTTWGTERILSDYDEKTIT